MRKKKAIEIKLNGVFHQYIKTTEIRLIYVWLKAGHSVTSKLIEMTQDEFEAEFGIN